MDSSWFSMRELKLLEPKPSSKDSNFRKDEGNLVKRAFDLLKSAETEIELHEQFKKVVLILGDTGNGKGKFSQWIAGDNTKLISRETEEGTGEYIIEDIHGTGRSIITSDTIYPQLVVDKETNLALYDCPGFNDTRDASNEIAATYFIKKVVDHAKSVKIIFVINYPSVRKGIDRHNFMKLAKHVADFVKNIEKYRNSISLVVTKVDNRRVEQGEEWVLIDNNKIITGVANFLIEVKQELEMKLQGGSSNERQLHEAAVKFISILLVKEEEQYARIGIFRRPDQQGPVSEIPLLQAEKKHIKRLIHENLIFSKKENNDFGYTISEKCKNIIHYFVQDINASVLSCLFRVKEEIKEYYTKIINVILNTIQSFVDEKYPIEDLQKVREMSTCLKDGCRSMQNLLKDVGSVTNPEDLAQKINAVVSYLNIDMSKNDLLDIETKGKYFNFLQVVSNRRFSIRQWDELIGEIYVYLYNARKNLQQDIDVVAPEICKQIESDFQQIAKAMQDQFDQKTQLLDMKEALEVLTHYHDVMLNMAAKTRRAMCATELLEKVADASRDININIPEHNVLNVIQQEKNLIFLKAISETEVNFTPSTWTHPFDSLVKHLNESIIWYRFLDGLYVVFSEYEIQKNREIYNVVDIEDWGKTCKPQGITVTKSNFQQFLQNITHNNIVAYDDVKNITLTELRLDELNQLLNLTLKHRPDIQNAEPSIFVRADYISTSEILDHNLNNGLNLSAALKSGVYKFLHIFALRKVFIDEDISFPGLELRIVSPKWEIIGTRTINLDGADGEPHSEIIAEEGVNAGSNGKNGKPGMPGKPGGNFVAIGACFINGANLTVTVNGGSGGPGQHGGNGREGERGKGAEYLSNEDLPRQDAEGVTRIKDFPCEILPCGNDSSIFAQVFRFIGSVFEQNPLYKIMSSHFAGNTLYKIIGSPGQAGGNGGNGGKGGKGGTPGIALIFDLRKNSKITIYANKGKDGVDGRGGEGGKDGGNGHIKFALLRNAPEPTPPQPLSIPGLPGAMPPLQVPIPGLPVPIPGLKVPIPGLPVSIPILPVPAAERRPEWVHQFDVPVETVSSGLNGTCGLNITGLKDPEPSNAVSEAFKIVRDYESYAKQNLKSRFKKALLVDFITRLNDNDEIKSLYALVI